MKRMLILVLTVLLIVSCKSHKKAGKEDSAEASNLPSLTLIASDLYGGAEEEVFEVIRDQAALQKFYRKVNMTRKPGLSVPQVDFTKNMAVLYCSGSTNTSEIPPMHINSQNDSEMVLIKGRVNVKDSVTQPTAALTPFGLYLLPLTDKQVIFSQK